MNPRNRDARRLRAVRRPHSLINTLSIRPSSKSNHDTSSFRCGSRLVFSVPSPERNVDTRPRNPLPPAQKYGISCPHLPTSTAGLDLPAVGDGQVQSPAILARLLIWCKRRSNSISVSSRLQGVWGLVGSYNFGAWTREVYLGGSCGEASCFAPACLRCLFCMINEKMRIQTVWWRRK